MLIVEYKGKDVTLQPWYPLGTVFDAEAWIETFNSDLLECVSRNRAMQGCGICFVLEAGGEIFLHTTSEGEVLLDVTAEAAWVAPVITASTGIEAPEGNIWVLPPNSLTQLIFGLNTLISATQIVLKHDYRQRKYN